MIRNPKYKVNDEVEFELNGDSLKGKIVVVLSHTCPISYVPTDLFINGINQSGVDRSTEEWLGEIEYKLNYKNWYCGHRHTNRCVKSINFLFDDIIEF